MYDWSKLARGKFVVPRVTSLPLDSQKEIPLLRRLLQICPCVVCSHIDIITINDDDDFDDDFDSAFN